jgi:FdhD protein
MAQLPINFQRYRLNQPEPVTDNVIVEAPVSLTVNGVPWLTFMCTPTDVEALAAGFLYNEGLVEGPAEVASVRACPTGDNVDVWLRRDITKPTEWRRTTGCTGGQTATTPETEAQRRVPAGRGLAAEQVGQLMAALMEAQTLYREAGGVHSSALSDGQGLVVVTEDVGRHNTLDKLAGRCLLDGRSAAGQVLLTTGRISSEMAQKAVRMGAPIVISRTSPSTLAISVAEVAGVTLIGYARRDRFNVYTHPERIRPAVLPPSGS